MTHEIQQLLEHVVLVKVEANIYGARKKLKKEDLVLADGSVLPPEDLASLGSKRLLDPDQLTIFNRLKRKPSAFVCGSAPVFWVVLPYRKAWPLMSLPNLNGLAKTLHPPKPSSWHVIQPQ